MRHVIRPYPVLSSVVLFAALLVIVLTATSAQPPLPDPFVPYEALRPGDPDTSISLYGASCHRIGYYGNETVCQLRAPEAPFRFIQAAIENSEIGSVTFRPVPGALRVGDLVALWGRPSYPGRISQTAKVAALRWPGRLVMVSTRGYRSMFAPVLVVIFSKPEDPRR